MTDASAAAPARNPELEEAILRAPDDFTNYVVYSDWLIEHGDPRGELITLQRLKKRRESEALLKEHAQHFFGRLAEFDDVITNIEWHMGFIRKCSVANTFDRNDDPRGMEIDDVLTELMIHPSTVFLRDLTIGILDFEGNDYSSLFGILGAHPKRALQRLYVGNFHSEETELNWSRGGTTAPLWSSDGGVRSLESFTLRSGSMDLVGINAPNLRELIIITGGFDRASLAAICSAEWPRLERLSLQLGQETDFAINELDAIFDGARFPALRHLGLTNTTISDAIAEAIVGSRIVKQLETLDLTLGTMSDDGAGALSSATGRAALGHLKRLDVSENFLSARAGNALTGVCGAVFDADQKNDRGNPNNRYISGYE